MATALSRRCRVHAEKMADEGWYTTANVLSEAAECLEKVENNLREKHRREALHDEAVAQTVKHIQEKYGRKVKKGG